VGVETVQLGQLVVGLLQLLPGLVHLQRWNSEQFVGVGISATFFQIWNSFNKLANKIQFKDTRLCRVSNPEQCHARSFHHQFTTQDKMNNHMTGAKLIANILRTRKKQCYQWGNQ
jgi:hypothetical protein